MLLKVLSFSLLALGLAACGAPKNCRKVGDTPISSTKEKVIVNGKEVVKVKEAWKYKCD